MAIIPEDEYPGQTDPASSNYPFGSAKNESAPDQLDGTPWERAVINDWFGFFQRLLTEASITPSGSPDNVNDSDYWDAVALLFPRVTPTQRVELTDNFDVGQFIVCSRVGDTVTITSDDGGTTGGNGSITHASGSQAVSVGVVPVEFRPTTTVSKVFDVVGLSEYAAVLQIRADGDVFVSYQALDGTSGPSRLNTGVGFSITYDIVANARP